MLPYLAKDKDGVAVFDCTTCRDPSARVGYQDPSIRAAWQCGWMAPEERSLNALTPDMFDGGFAFDDGTCCDICPGYLAQLPQVAEAADATWALRKNVLPLYFDDPSALLLDAVKVLDQSYSAYEGRKIAEGARGQ